MSWPTTNTADIRNLLNVQHTGKPMANANETLIDLDNLDSVSLDSFDSAPEFIEPPAGRYKLGVQVKIEKYERDEKDAEGDKTGMKVAAKRIRFVYSIQDVVELKSKNELAPAEGSMFSETFTATQEGLPYFKTRASAILGDLGKASIKEVIEELNGESISFMADVKLRVSKVKDADGNEKDYTNVNVRVVSAFQKAELRK